MKEYLNGTCDCGNLPEQCECNDREEENKRNITYVEDVNGQQFALINCNDLDPETYLKQVEFKNLPECEFEYLIDAPVEEIKEKIKRILKAHYK